ncbi:MAG TPA: hypothetical protein VMV55_01975 [Methanoregula sp.]|nr:hypothetical protein [Methanoregula sp.]
MVEQVINGLRYDTEKSTLIASSKDGAKHLYQTKNKRFFVFFERPGQSTITPYLEAIPSSRAKKEYGSMPKQVVPWNKVFGGKVEDA